MRRTTTLLTTTGWSPSVITLLILLALDFAPSVYKTVAVAAWAPSCTRLGTSTRLFSAQEPHHSSPDQTIKDGTTSIGAPLSRRAWFLASSTTPAILAATTALSGAPLPAQAFSNKISTQYDDRPKRRGAMPQDLGIKTRKDMVGDPYIGLKPCGSAPNCFCSTDDAEDFPDFHIPAWSWPSQSTSELAFDELLETLKGYPPGQANIDGGGFQIVKADKAGLYIYAQFESLKNGYIDDVEFAVVPSVSKDAFQVRSSSRVGYLDYGVNAKRLNWLAKELVKKKWTAEGVNFITHPDYALQNNVK